MIDFHDRVAVVTDARRGPGRLYALDLARRGAAVVVNGRLGIKSHFGQRRDRIPGAHEELRRST